MLFDPHTVDPNQMRQKGHPIEYWNITMTTTTTMATTTTSAMDAEFVKQ